MARNPGVGHKHTEVAHENDRTLRSIVVSLPPFIANRAVALDSETEADLESATSEIAKLDSSRADDLSALGTLLLRTESVASSKIEQIQANADDYARANSSAIAMAAATTALQAMIATVGPNPPIRLSAITSAHAALMHDDPLESAAAGELRTVQNWIGGGDFSPRGALYIPPPPETVPGYMDDLVTFADRSDMPALLQAAIAHAQFESIHTFTDGNGRIGRALINTILRRRGATTRVVVPRPRHWSRAARTTSMHWAVTAPVTLLPSQASLCARPGSPRPNRASPRNAVTKSPASGGN